MRIFLFVFALLMFIPAAFAADMQYIPDPIYQSFDPKDTSPMQDMIDLANGGDVRAQFILGDLYSKGKGGLAKNEKKGAEWFEIAAKNGYFEGFVRLAAMAKRHERYVEAYKWYSLAINYLDYGPWRKHASKARDELEEVHKFTSAERDEARMDANKWKSDMRKAREEEKEREEAAARQRRQELAAAEKKAKADAKAAAKAAKETPKPKPEPKEEPAVDPKQEETKTP